MSRGPEGRRSCFRGSLAVAAPCQGHTCASRRWRLCSPQSPADAKLSPENPPVPGTCRHLRPVSVCCSVRRPEGSERPRRLLQGRSRAGATETLPQARL